MQQNSSILEGNMCKHHYSNRSTGVSRTSIVSAWIWPSSSTTVVPNLFQSGPPWVIGNIFEPPLTPFPLRLLEFSVYSCTNITFSLLITRQKYISLYILLWIEHEQKCLYWQMIVCHCEIMRPN